MHTFIELFLYNRGDRQQGRHLKERQEKSVISPAYTGWPKN